MLSLYRFAFATCVAMLCVGVIGVEPAISAPKASIVVDMRDGKVLYSRSADRRLHPASLTKMMTLYMTFDAIKRGKLRLNQKITVSRKAARMPASKLYLRAGQRVTVKSLIRATAIKSANDAAMVLAEAIGGSQSGFARMMTRQAKRLGMGNTRFKNPHGLTQRGHYSTARDMSILARHLFYDFPQYYNIFKRRSDYAAGKRIWTTNRLLSSYPGADGIKTGYTRAAGYNLVASAYRKGKRIIAVAFGERSSAARTAKVTRLLDVGFSKARNGVRTKRPNAVVVATKTTPRRGRVRVKTAPLPVRRPSMRMSVSAAVAEVLAAPASASTLSPEERRTKRSRYAPRVARLPLPRKQTGRRIAADTKSPKLRPAPTASNVPLPVPKPLKLASR